MRHSPSIEFIHDALPENARAIDDAARPARASDEAVAAVAPARRTPARPTRTRSRRVEDGDEDPRTTPRTSRHRRTVTTRRARRRRQARRDHLARRGRPDPPTGRHPEGRPRRHARPDGHRRPGGRHQPGHPAARAPDADRQGVRRHGPAGGRHHHRRRRGRGDRDPTRPTVTDEASPIAGWRRWSARSSRCRPRSPRSRSTASAPTSGSATARTVELTARPGPIGPRSRSPVERTSATASTSTSVVRCSSGTYIRAIARDLGAALGVGGHLTALRRTAVGPFGLDGRAHPGRAGRRVRDAAIADAARASFPSYELDEAQAPRRAGRPPLDLRRTGVRGLRPDGEFLALYEPRRRPGPTRSVAVFTG